ncbi:uncharacterized protein METZ01_LOCUS444819 [marine metagenome]|uniref:Uncharacterized protein n=1 Tax=marine metagenome TaxID=408172 RepID=A0A382ZA49_9ZZZZ
MLPVGPSVNGQPAGSALGCTSDPL